MSEAPALSLAMVEFLRWIGSAPRTYRETMDAWRTSCPRLSLWEDASIAGHITLQCRGDETIVVLSDDARALIV